MDLHKYSFGGSLLALAAFLLAPGGASAAEIGTTEYLLADCKEQRTAFCPTFIRGFAEGHNVAWFWDEHGICIPGKATTIQLISVFTKWAESHPELWHERDAEGITKALLETFPCARKGAS